MKKLLFSAILLSISFQSSAESIFTDEERAKLLSSVPEKLTSIWNDPHVKSCWEEAELGSDKALSALYLIGRGREIIDEVSRERQEILASSRTQEEAYRNLRKSFNRDDYKRVERAVTMLPKSWKYCEKVHKLKNKDN